MPKPRSLRKFVRGSVVIVPYPNADMRTTKMRPALIIQSNTIDSEIPQVLIAMISSNLKRAGRKSRVLVSTADAGDSGLLFDSVVMADNLATILESQIVRVIGQLDKMSDVDNALRHCLDL